MKVMGFGLPTFVKWAGGKTQLLPQLDYLLPENFKDYYEPFLGSGAFFFYLEQERGCKAFLSDINGELINTFEVVKKKPKALASLLSKHKSQHSNEHYYAVRKVNPIDLSKVERAARFIYLNKSCFNGLYRVNSKGKFNVPIGSYKNPSIFSEENLLSASKLLQKAKLKTASFECVLVTAKKGDFVYFDPPYYPIKKTSFTSYTKEAFGEKEQRKLVRVFKKLDKRGCFVMLSNSDAPFIRELYTGFKQKIVKARRAINCNGADRGRINELVVTNY